MHHARIVKQQRRPGLGERKALASGRCGFKNTRLAALDGVARDKNHGHQIDKAVQTAFREVADALAERATLAERLQAQQSLQAATLKALQLSQARYRLGADSYLPVLDAERALYSAQQTLIGLALAEQANRITLYKVLGGRWIDTTPGDSTATPGP